MKITHFLFVFLSSVVGFAQPRFVKERANYEGDEVMYPFSFEVKNAEQQSLKGTVRFSGRLDGGELEVIQLDQQKLEAYPYREMRGAILSEGYLPKFFSVFPMDLPNRAVYASVLEPLEEGKVFVAEGITFLGDQTHIYYTSIDALQSVLAFLNMHPTLRIRIIGHVNATAETTLSDNQLNALAKQRAEAVMEYLVLHGVSKHRISIIGSGRAGVKYPNPQTEAELDYNRRVEIEILGM
jgi:outer membrane protein OmpA-like peptidoglycan-associated protein